MHLFLSYPKAGRTWVRFMVDDYLCRREGLSLPNVFDIESKLKATPRHIEWSHLTAAMIFRMPYYQMGAINVEQLKGLPAVLLTRNVYATMASAYFQARDRVKVFNGTPSQFLRSPRYGIIKFVTFFNLLFDLRGTLGPTAVVSYEAMKRNTEHEMTRVLEGLNIEIDAALLRQSIAAGTMENMRTLGLTAAYAKTPLAPMDAADPNSFKVSAAGRARHDELFNDEDRAYIRRVIDDLLTEKNAEHLRESLAEPPESARAA